MVFIKVRTFEYQEIYKYLNYDFSTNFELWICSIFVFHGRFKHSKNQVYTYKLPPMYLQKDIPCLKTKWKIHAELEVQNCWAL